MEPKDEQGRAQLHREAEAHEDAAEAARRADYAPQNHEDTRGDQGRSGEIPARLARLT